MANKKTAQFFVWLAPGCDWSGGRLHLVQGEVYDARLVDAEVLTEWIRSGAAQAAEAKEK